MSNIPGGVIYPNKDFGGNFFILQLFLYMLQRRPNRVSNNHDSSINELPRAIQRKSVKGFTSVEICDSNSHHYVRRRVLPQGLACGLPSSETALHHKYYRRLKHTTFSQCLVGGQFSVFCYLMEVYDLMNPVPLS